MDVNKLLLNVEAPGGRITLTDLCTKFALKKSDSMVLRYKTENGWTGLFESAASPPSL